MKNTPKIIDPVVFAKNIRKYRKSMGLRQKELAQKIDVSNTSMNAYEMGNSMPTLDTLIKMSRLFGVTVESLVEPIGVTANFNSIEEELIRSCVNHIAMLNTEIKQEEIFDLGSNHTDTSHQENMKKLEYYKSLFVSVAEELKKGV